jgi:hypothetical protein
VTFDIGRDVLDADPTPKLLTEKIDVAADDRSEIDENRLFTRLQELEEFGERFRRVGRVLRRRRIVVRICGVSDCGGPTAPEDREEVGE